MPKYYVQSGQLKGIAAADTPREAAKRLIRQEVKNCKNISLDQIVWISEKGFDSRTDGDVFMPILQLLEELGYEIH